MKVSDIGERELLRLIFPIITVERDDIAINVGDDAAAVIMPQGKVVLTTDMMVAGIHYRPADISPRQLGRKALATNVSDIAAMAAVPRFALVALGLPADTEIDYVLELFNGMQSLAAEYGLAIVGGDLTGADKLVISITVVGNTIDGLGRRNTARPDDIILVTGSLGGSALGLKYLLTDKTSSESAEVFIRFHQEPIPRVQEAITAIQSGIHALEDISDGLLTEISHICESSNSGAIIDIDSIPVPKGFHDACRAVNANPLDLFLAGGEDYELVMTCPSGQLNDVVKAIESATKTPVTPIGIITAETGAVLLRSKTGVLSSPGAFGYEHFQH